MKLVAFGFAAQVGKSLSCKYLADKYGFIEDAFAYSLKQGIGKGVFGLSDDQMEYGKETIDPFWNITPRKILQMAGTDAMRNIFGEDIWLKTLERRIMLQPERAYAIMDVRFPNEAELIKKLGGILVSIERDIVGTNSKHISEIAMDSYTGWDYKIDNNSTFENLYKQLDVIIESNYGKR